MAIAYLIFQKIFLYFTVSHLVSKNKNHKDWHYRSIFTVSLLSLALCYILQVN